MNEIDKNGTQVAETFRTVEPLTLPVRQYPVAFIGGFSGKLSLELDLWTVAEFRALIEWGIKALPCEHVGMYGKGYSQCLNCGATLT